MSKATRKQYWSKIKNMKNVANRPGSDGIGARIRLNQIAGVEGFVTEGKVTIRQVRQVYSKLRRLEKAQYKAIRALNPKMKSDQIWREVGRVMEEDDTSWNPYPEGEEGSGED